MRQGRREMQERGVTCGAFLVVGPLVDASSLRIALTPRFTFLRTAFKATRELSLYDPVRLAVLTPAQHAP
jgi:hypothetical protein